MLLILGEDADESKRLCVGDRTADVNGIHALIILKRLIERVHARIFLRNAVERLGDGTHRGSVFPVNLPPHSFC